MNGGLKPGEVFGKLKVLGMAGRDGHGNRFWWCVCICRGYDPARPVRCREDHLRSGKKKSCGCIRPLAQNAKTAQVGESVDANTDTSAETLPFAHQRVRNTAQTPDLCEHGYQVDNPQVSTSKHCEKCKAQAEKVAAAMREYLAHPNAPERDGKGKYVITGGNDSTKIENIAAHCDERSIYEGREQKGTHKNRPGGFIGGSGGANYGAKGRKHKMRNPMGQGATPSTDPDDFDADPEHGYERHETIEED